MAGPHSPHPALAPLAGPSAPRGWVPITLRLGHPHLTLPKPHFPPLFPRSWPGTPRRGGRRRLRELRAVPAPASPSRPLRAFPSFPAGRMSLDPAPRAREGLPQPPGGMRLHLRCGAVGCARPPGYLEHRALWVGTSCSSGTESLRQREKKKKKKTKQDKNPPPTPQKPG